MLIIFWKFYLDSKPCELTLVVDVLCVLNEVREVCGEVLSVTPLGPPPPSSDENSTSSPLVVPRRM